MYLYSVTWRLGIVALEVCPCKQRADISLEHICLYIRVCVYFTHIYIHMFVLKYVCPIDALSSVGGVIRRPIVWGRERTERATANAIGPWGGSGRGVGID